MSFARLDGVARLAPSTLIKEDLIASEHRLGRLDLSLQEYIQLNRTYVPLAEIGVDLEKIILLFNDNINYINRVCKEEGPKYSVPFEKSFPKYEDFKKINSKNSDEKELQEEYDHVQVKSYFSFHEKYDEIRQLAQVGYRLVELGEKIDAFMQRCKARQLFPDGMLPELNKLSLEDALRVYDYRYLNLRDPTDYEKNSKIRAMIQARAEQIMNSRGTKSVSSASVANDASAPTSPSVALDWLPPEVGSYGICCEPDWGDRPVPIENHASFQQAHIPIGKQFKFVIVHEGKVLRWEEGQNRCFMASEPLPESLDRRNFY